MATEVAWTDDGKIVKPIRWINGGSTVRELEADFPLGSLPEIFTVRLLVT